YTVYFDVYTKIATCKARYPFTVNVYPNPIGYTNFNGEDRCTGVPLLFKDSSQITSGYIAKVKWLFDDNTEIISDSLRTHKTFTYDPFQGAVTRFYRHIPISDHNCTDTVLSAVNA